MIEVPQTGDIVKVEENVSGTTYRTPSLISALRVAVQT